MPLSNFSFGKEWRVDVLTLKHEMLTEQNLTFTESFSCRIWRHYEFPAYTQVSAIAKQLDCKENTLKTAIKRQRRTFNEWDIDWGDTLRSAIPTH